MFQMTSITGRYFIIYLAAYLFSYHFVCYYRYFTIKLDEADSRRLSVTLVFRGLIDLVTSLDGMKYLPTYD